MGLSIYSNDDSVRQSADFRSAMILRAFERLSSGLAIVRAADDPSGLVISEQLRSRIATLNAELDNTSLLIHKYQTASSHLMEMREQLTELRSLAVGAGNEGLYDETAYDAWADAANHMVQHYNWTVANADFNGMNLLDGSPGSVANIGRLQSLDVSSAEAARSAVSVIDEKIGEVDSTLGEIGAFERFELQSRRESLEVTAQNLQAAESLLRDVDYAKEFSFAVGQMICLRASAALMAHSYLTAKSVLDLFRSET